MITIANRAYSSAAACSFVLGLLAVFALLAAEKFYWTGSTIFSEGPPDFAGDRIARSALICASMALILLSLTGSGGDRIALSDGCDGLLGKIGAGLTLALSAAFTTLFVAAPSVFSRASEEDGPVEWASAGLLFSSSFVFLANFVRHRRSPCLPRCAAWWLVVSASVFFVIGMEEVSWFQRVLGLETPAVFRENL